MKTYWLYLNKCPASSEKMLGELEELIDIDLWKQTKGIIGNKNNPNRCHCLIDCGYNMNNANLNARGNLKVKGDKNKIYGKDYLCLIEVPDQEAAKTLENYFKSKKMLVEQTFDTK